MSPSACVICTEAALVVQQTATGERAYCKTCFHAWRTSIDPFSYSATAMCSLGTSEERLLGQVGFVAPFCPPGGHILEIGCATGELAAVARRELAPERYDGIELSPAGRQAEAHLDQLFTRPLRDLLADEEIQVGYDAILMSHVLEHLEEPVAELAAMVRALKPGGAIFIEVPNGAGHRRLPFDDNRSHLHFFNLSSLSRALASQGLEIIAATTDAWLDARYADSIRVVARPFAVAGTDRTMLSDHPLLKGEDQIVVWGGGSLTSEMLANFFDPSRIDFFIDRDPAKQGSTLLGRPVRAPDALGTTPRTVLLNSIDFAPAIAADLKALYPDTPHRAVPIADLLS